ncbi:MAG: S41 family peptidase [Prevotellaceae bacterium]|jgi:carboxyl-terminal processing protease|nr:S41 family peptidase [Prevotellaceae bacterium]
MKNKHLGILFLNCCWLMASTLPAQGFSSLQQRKILNVMSAISNVYVDTINEKSLTDVAITAMLKELDPHSSYIPQKEVERVNEPLEGSFEGIGIQFQMFEDTLLVVQTIAGCPAEKVGILPGDRIIYVDDELIAGGKKQNSDILKLLRGPKGSEVTVKINRGGEKDLLLFKIIRDKIPVYSVDAHYMAGKDIGYIKINNFGSNTLSEYKKAMADLQKKGMKQLVLGLQGNGGGYLNAAVELADEFLSHDKTIVYTQGRNDPKKAFYSSSIGNFEKNKLVILVDEYSASASEIVSGAVQDWDRGVIVGRRTFGKGLVQRQLPLIDGSMLRLTSARYYTPTGRSIQKPYKGVDYEKDLLERYNHGEMQHIDSIRFPDSLKYKTVTLQRTVYGGGGIMPDIFVPIDTAGFTRYHRSLVSRGVINKTYLQYLDKNRNALKSAYPTFEKFRDTYELSDELMQLLRSKADAENITFDEAQYAVSEALIKLQLTALIAGDLWTTSEYYQIIDRQNDLLQRAVEILQTPGEYERILSP